MCYRTIIQIIQISCLTAEHSRIDFRTTETLSDYAQTAISLSRCDMQDCSALIDNVSEREFDSQSTTQLSLSIGLSLSPSLPLSVCLCLCWSLFLSLSLLEITGLQWALGRLIPNWPVKGADSSHIHVPALLKVRYRLSGCSTECTGALTHK